MNKRKLFFWLFIALLISCHNEPLGLPSEEEEDVTEEPEFATGGICIGYGGYEIDTTNLLSDF